ncbi:hypothetical protein [Sporosarcina psychrophila]|uniref:Uncharacterized protein n=1 Tax=Sporosarcina psychrophila TaxID=1476 RepID=A0ABV2KEW0_SPOPS
MKQNLSEPILPSVTEFEAMALETFEEWTHRVERKIREREELRNPLFHLKKRIANILKDSKLKEEIREIRVLHEIENHKRFTAHSR